MGYSLISHPAIGGTTILGNLQMSNLPTMTWCLIGKMMSFPTTSGKRSVNSGRDNLAIPAVGRLEKFGKTGEDGFTLPFYHPENQEKHEKIGKHWKNEE